MSVAGKMRLIEKVEIRIGTKRPRLYLVPKDKTRGVESLLSEYLAEDQETVSLDDAFRELNSKFSKQGNVLCGLRLKKGWTQTALANKIGTSQANVAAMENGKRRIGKTLAQKFADVFETSAQVFF
ncbi:helix-turn-helix transcriptional regulator [Bdellovibrionota bacterium FG-2]